MMIHLPSWVLWTLGGIVAVVVLFYLLIYVMILRLPRDVWPWR